MIEMTLQEKMREGALCCLGTPFHHQGRAGGMGLDCIGLVIHAMRAAGLVVKDNFDYGQNPEPEKLAAALTAHGFTPALDIQTGDVLVMRILRQPQHVALALTDCQMIHAYKPAGKVITSGINETWARRISAIYRLRNGH